MKTSLLMSVVLSVSLVSVALFIAPSTGPEPAFDAPGSSPIAVQTTGTLDGIRSKKAPGARHELSPSVPAAATHTPEPGPYRLAPRSAERRHGEPSWAVPFGQEFWRASSVDAATGPDDEPVIEGSGLDLGDAIARVSHALQIEEGIASVTSETYGLELDEVVRFRPHLPVETTSRDGAGDGEASQPGVEPRSDLEIEIETRHVKLGAGRGVTSTRGSLFPPRWPSTTLGTSS